MMDAEAVGLRAMEWCAVLLHAYLLLAAAIVALSVGATLFGVQVCTLSVVTLCLKVQGSLIVMF